MQRPILVGIFTFLLHFLSPEAHSFTSHQHNPIPITAVKDNNRFLRYHLVEQEDNTTPEEDNYAVERPPIDMNKGANGSFLRFTNDSQEETTPESEQNNQFDPDVETENFFDSDEFKGMAPNKDDNRVDTNNDNLPEPNHKTQHELMFENFGSGGDFGFQDRFAPLDEEDEFHRGRPFFPNYENDVIDGSLGYHPLADDTGDFNKSQLGLNNQEEIDQNFKESPQDAIASNPNKDIMNVNLKSLSKRVMSFPGGHEPWPDDDDLILEHNPYQDNRGFDATRYDNHQAAWNDDGEDEDDDDDGDDDDYFVYNPWGGGTFDESFDDDIYMVLDWSDWMLQAQQDKIKHKKSEHTANKNNNPLPAADTATIKETDALPSSAARQQQSNFAAVFAMMATFALACIF